VYRFAQILHASGAGADVAPILFTWPSAGNVFAYKYDRDSANYSRDALEKLLRYLQDDPDIKTTSVLAHRWETGRRSRRSVKWRPATDASPRKSKWCFSRTPTGVSQDIRRIGDRGSTGVSMGLALRYESEGADRMASRQISLPLPYACQSAFLGGAGVSWFTKINFDLEAHKGSNLYSAESRRRSRGDPVWRARCALKWVTGEFAVFSRLRATLRDGARRPAAGRLRGDDRVTTQISLICWINDRSSQTIDIYGAPSRNRTSTPCGIRF
jgi:Alpha/beta hydrolase of unknown function (DUF900)